MFPPAGSIALDTKRLPVPPACRVQDSPVLKGAGHLKSHSHPVWISKGPLGVVHFSEQWMPPSLWLIWKSQPTAASVAVHAFSLICFEVMTQGV